LPWGDEDEVHRLFASLASWIEVRPRTLRFESESVVSFVEFWEKTNPPLMALKNMLPQETYQQVLIRMSELVQEMNESPHPAGSHGERADLPTRWGGANVKLSSPYILVLAQKPA